MGILSPSDDDDDDVVPRGFLLFFGCFCFCLCPKTLASLFFNLIDKWFFLIASPLLFYRYYLLFW